MGIFGGFKITKKKVIYSFVLSCIIYFFMWNASCAVRPLLAKICIDPNYEGESFLDAPQVPIKEVPFTCTEVCSNKEYFRALFGVLVAFSIIFIIVYYFISLFFYFISRKK